VALAVAPLTPSRESRGPWGRVTARQLAPGGWLNQSGLTVLQITKRPLGSRPLVAHAGYASVAPVPQSGIISKARLLHAQGASQFVVGMLAPTSGDSLGTGERSGPRSLGVRAAPIFTSAPPPDKMNIRSHLRHRATVVGARMLHSGR
jgi:hypothetical protein